MNASSAVKAAIPPMRSSYDAVPYPSTSQANLSDVFLNDFPANLAETLLKMSRD
jgi:hypothetical protein